MKIDALFTVLIAVGVCFFSAGCSREENSEKKAQVSVPIPVTIAQAVQKDFDVTLSSFGHVSSYSRVEVKPRVSGHIISVHFSEGQEVEKGDLLFKIDPRKTEASLEQAKATLANDEARLINAQNNYNRAKALFESVQPLISREEMDSITTSLRTAEASVAADKASIENILLTLEFSEITAPIAGKTGAIQVDLGNVVASDADTLVSINQIHPISVEFSIPEKFLFQLRKTLGSSDRSKVNVYDNDTGSFISSGELNFMENHVDQNTGMINVSAYFENENNELWPGQFVRISMQLEKIKDAIVIPSVAVQSGQNGDFVYVVKPDNTLEYRLVEVSVQRGLESVIASGISPGENVVTDGQLRLTPESSVTIFKSLDDAVDSILDKSNQVTNTQSEEIVD